MTHLNRAFDAAQRGMGSLIGGTAKFAAKLGAVGLAMAGVASAGQALHTIGSFLKQSSQAASGVESLKMQFEVLLGSADAAGKRIEEITKFAASTPFEVDELARTSKLLQTLGGTLLATGDGLRMVGDATAIAGQPIEEMGLHIGRLFNALTSGTSAGEAVARLQEVGLITGIAKNQFEALAAAQKKGTQPILTQTQALTLLQNVMGQTSGAMAKLSATTEGKLSNMADAVSQLKVAFGEGLNVGVKAFAEAGSLMAASMQKSFAKAGSILGNALKDSVSGDYEGFVDIGMLIGQVIAEGVKLGLKTALMETGGGILGTFDNIDNFLRDSLGLRGVLGSSNLSGNFQAGKNQYLRSSAQDAVDAIAAAFRSKYEPVGVTPLAQKLYDQGTRGSDPGYQGTEMGKMLNVLEKIERKTAPIKF